jgi:hypothetical protein
MAKKYISRVERGEKTKVNSDLAKKEKKKQEFPPRDP